MSITRTAPPSKDLSVLRNRLRSFFEEPFGFDLRMPIGFPRRDGAFAWSPAVEAVERPTEYLLHAELPGVSPENVEVSVVDGVLTLRGTKEEERRTDDKDRMLHLWEREYGHFERTFRFPLEVDDAKVSADFANGVLTIRVPKVAAPQAVARTVPIAKK